MYIKKRVARRSFFARHRVLLLFLVGISGCLAASIFVRARREFAADRGIRAPEQYQVPNIVAALRPQSLQRVVYPYSVIPGGVSGREELAASVARDQTVAAHYADFGVDRARVVSAKETQFMHVAYRLQNKVFWTAKKLRIPKGEMLISDGVNSARVRCGNRVSAAPMEPTSDEEPAIETFDFPDAPAGFESIPELPQTALLAPIGPEPSLELIPTPGSDLGILELPPGPPRFSSIREPLSSMTQSPPNIDAPEPATGSLFAAGLATLVALRVVRRKRK